MRSRRRQAVLSLLVVMSLALGDLGAAARSAPKRRSRAPRRPPAPVSLVWHVETENGDDVGGLGSDTPINPASVVKVATTLWALEKLGPEHRFDTTFETSGSIDDAHGTLRGDLIVRGGGDPDFHVENAFIIAGRLNQLGIRKVTGSVRVDERFWIGWEGGSERVIKVREARAVMMAQRLSSALDPTRWTVSTRRAWSDFAARYSLGAARPPGVAIAGRAGLARSGDGNTRVLLVHRSKPLIQALRRFDAYSNNDIERLGDSLGTPREMAQLLTTVLGANPDAVRLETISGLGTNRMTPRLVVRLLRQLRATCERLGLSIESVLPVAGCDPGTLNHSFARLCSGPNRMCLVGKTGTLTYTDGGAAVLAGFVKTGRGDMAFCVAAPGASGRLGTARRQQAEWVERLIAASDGPRARTCAVPLGFPEGDAQIILRSGAGSSAGGNAAR